MAIVIRCPACSRDLRVPDDLLDQRVKCPACGQVFDGVLPAQPVPATAPPTLIEEPQPVASVEGTPADEDAGFGYVEVADQGKDAAAEPEQPSPKRARSRRCPSCGERTARTASRCPECGAKLRSLDADDPDELYFQRRDCEPHRGPTILILGIGSLVMTPFFCFWLPVLIGLPLGMVAWVMGHRDLRRMDRGEVDREGRGATQGGMVCGIVGTILNGLIGLVLVGMIGLFVVGAQARRSAAPPAPLPRPAAPPPKTEPLPGS